MERKDVAIDILEKSLNSALELHEKLLKNKIEQTEDLEELKKDISDMIKEIECLQKSINILTKEL